MKKIVLFILVVIILIAGAAVIYFVNWGFNKSASNTGSQIQVVRGQIAYIDPDLKIIMIKDETSRDVNLNLDSNTALLDDANNSAQLSFYAKTFEVEAKGNWKNDNTFNVLEIRVFKAPNIVVFSPEPGDTVNEKIDVSGRARVFENQFSIRVSSSGTPIYATGAMTNASSAGQFGDFQKQIELDPSLLDGASSIMLEVFDTSPKDGSEIDKVSIPLKYESTEGRVIKVFFSNSKMDQSFSCSKVFPVTRIISDTPAVARAVIGELLKGPTDDEKTQGFFTNINQGVQIQSLVIDSGGTAHIDFNNTLQYQVGGSCRTAAIRAQIERTLEQFSGVKNVFISINGNSTSTLLQEIK